MTRDPLSSTVDLREAGLFERAYVGLSVCLFPASRRRRAEYLRVRALLAGALGETDEAITLRTKARRRVRAPKATVILLVALLLGIALEWGTYTLPKLAEVSREFAHSCGLK